MDTKTSPVVPIAEPITGREPPGDPGAPASALAQFYRAFNSRDLALMEANWDASPDVAMDNPLGGILRSWSEIRKVYERIFSAPRRVEVEFHDYTLHVIGNVFYAVGRERGRIVADATRPDMRLAIRTTRIYRRVSERWCQVHHHGSIDDPAILEAYQRAVR